MTKLPSLDQLLLLDLLLEDGGDVFPVPPEDVLEGESLETKQLFSALEKEGWLEETEDYEHYALTAQARDNRTTIRLLAAAISRSGIKHEPRANTREFEAACNGEIDVIPVGEVGDDILEELDDWSEIGWRLLECGCLVGPEGMPFHNHSYGVLDLG
jgi:hypothetical protein